MFSRRYSRSASLAHALALGWLLLAGPGVASAEAEEEEAVAFFETHIRPLFIAHCYECHSADSGEQKGGLRLDSRAGWERGGDHGRAVVPGDPEASLLLRAVSYADNDLQMPPDGRLPKEARRRLHEWVARGAPDPRDGPVGASEENGSAEAARDAASHWSFQPVERVPVPVEAMSDWSLGPSDALVEARRSEAGLHPVGEADAFALLRRYHFVLTGLPPSAETLETFLAPDGEVERPDRWERLTDRLLASPRYGEQWGRHWMDVTRFAESSGGGRSLMFKNAWHFRDYVIEAFNDDVPFDTFIREHLAGDLLFERYPLEAPRQRERLIGSGFLALGPTNYELQDKELLRMEVVDEQIDTVGRAFMGMTLGCARCHDHKFDPVSTEDYYALAGIFRSTKTLTPGNVSGYVETPLPGPGYRERLTYERELEKRKAELELAKKRDKKAVKRLEAELKQFQESAPPKLALAMTVWDEEPAEIADCQVRIRGAVRSLGDGVPRGFLTAATPEGLPARPDLGGKESGRLALADWLVNPRHPLTSRVYVNRLWHHVMGVGLVRTVDNFGKTGELPSHPRLLDYLAHRFPRDGAWATKPLLRELLVSRTFRLASGGCGSAGEGLAGLDSDPDTAARDSENRWWWRAHERTLSAENLRDAMLRISGSLI